MKDVTVQDSISIVVLYATASFPRWVRSGGGGDVGFYHGLVGRLTRPFAFCPKEGF